MACSAKAWVASAALSAWLAGAARVTTFIRAEDTLANCDLSHYGGLTERFTVIKTVGQGANGCVVLAKDTKNGNIEVAVKVAKKAEGGKKSSWVEECQRSKRIHARACQGTREQLQLVERYIPRCVEVGGTDTAPYIVMHNADGTGIGDSLRLLPKGGPVRMNVFMQAVGALTAMHGLGFSHNDLHDNNVVILSRKPGPYLVFIDFGEVVPLSKAVYNGGYKQDANLLSRLAGQLASCPPEALFPFNKEQVTEEALHRKDKLLECLEEEWNIFKDKSFPAFKNAFGAVMDEAFQQQKQYDSSKKKPNIQVDSVPALFNTEFVQKHHVQPEPFFPGTCGDEDDANKESHTTKTTTTKVASTKVTTTKPTTTKEATATTLTETTTTSAGFVPLPGVAVVFAAILPLTCVFEHILWA